VATIARASWTDDAMPGDAAVTPSGPMSVPEKCNDEPGMEFSARERALVELLAAGHTDASAARRLGVSPRTVSYTLQSLMDRLQVENRFQLGLAIGTLGAQEVTQDSMGADADRPPEFIDGT